MAEATRNHESSTSRKSVRKIPDGYQLVPPDGNYSWIVAIACFIGGLVTVVPIPTFSVLLYDIIALYDTNTATASWIPSIVVSTGQCLGPLNTIIVNVFGVRKSAIVGSLAISVGMTISYFVYRIELLCITYGIISGFGNGLCILSLNIVLSQYFRKYYGIAYGFLNASLSAARLVTIPTVQYLLELYGCHGVFLLIGAFTLHTCVMALLFEPVQWHLVLVPINRDGQKLLLEAECDKPLAISENNDNGTKTEMIQVESIAIGSKYLNEFGSVSDICVREDIKTEQVKSSDCFYWPWCYKKVFENIDFSLLREPCFYIICINSTLLLNIKIFGNLFLFPLGVEKERSPIELASITSSKALVDIVSNIAGPSIATYFNLSVRKFFITLGFVNGLILATAVYVDSYNELMAWSIASGLAFGATSSLSGVLIVETMGVKRLSSVMGLSVFIQGFLLLPMAPILGWIRDTTGSFANIYLVLALMEFVLITLWIIKPYLPQKPFDDAF